MKGATSTYGKVEVAFCPACQNAPMARFLVGVALSTAFVYTSGEKAVQDRKDKQHEITISRFQLQKGNDGMEINRFPKRSLSWSIDSGQRGMGAVETD